MADGSMSPATAEQVKADLLKALGGAGLGFSGAPGMGAENTPNPMDPWPGRFNKRGNMICGPCVEDESWRSSETVLSVQRFGTFYVMVKRSAGGALYISKTGTSPLQIFTAAAGEDGAEAGLPAGVKLTSSDTNAAEEGALTGHDKIDFRIAGMGVHIEEPFRLTTVEGDANSQLVEDFWATYADRLVRRFARSSVLTIRHGKTDAGKYNMGKLQFHPAMGGLVGAGGLTVGSPLAAAFVPFNGPDFGGGPNDEDGLTLELSTTRTIGTPADAGAPVPALAGSDVFLLPICVELIGRPVRNDKVVSRGDMAAVAAETTVDVVRKMLAVTDMTKPEEVAALQRYLGALGR